MKPLVRIEKWFVSGSRLVGDVYLHPLIDDGTTITTGRIIDINFKLNMAETENTIYQLGTPIKVSESAEGSIN